MLTIIPALTTKIPIYDRLEETNGNICKSSPNLYQLVSFAETFEKIKNIHLLSRERVTLIVHVWYFAVRTKHLEGTG